MVQGRSSDDSGQPGAEPIRIGQLTQPRVDSHHGFLDNVLRLRMVTHEPLCGEHCSRTVPAVRYLKGLDVSLKGFADQI